MNTFVVDASNKIIAHASDVWVDDGSAKFRLEQELAALAATWPGTRLVEVWNKLPGVKPVSKFTDRKTAVNRIWSAIQRIEPLNPSTSTPKKQPASKPRARKPTPATIPKGGSESKTVQVLAALRSPTGATLQQLIKVTGWQSHSVRGFLSAQVSKRMGLRVKSFKRDGERVYRIRP